MFESRTVADAGKVVLAVIATVGAAVCFVISTPPSSFEIGSADLDSVVFEMETRSQGRLDEAIAVEPGMVSNEGKLLARR